MSQNSPGECGIPSTWSHTKSSPQNERFSLTFAQKSLETYLRKQHGATPNWDHVTHHKVIQETFHGVFWSDPSSVYYQGPSNQRD